MSLSAHDRFVRSIFVDPGYDSDVDAAFEDAVDTARIEFGLSGVIPSVASLSADDITDPSETRPTTLARATTLALRDPALEQANVAHLRALAPDANFKRRRLTIRIDDVSAPLTSDGDLPLTDEVEAWVLAQLPADAPLGEGEFVESVEVRSYRPRFKPVATPHAGGVKRTFVVHRAGFDEVLATGSTAGEARREAVALAKAGVLDGLEAYTLEVSMRARRDDGSDDGAPYVSVERTKIAQKATLRVVLASEKNPEKTKHVGWLFYGRIASEDIASEGSAPEDTMPEADPENVETTES